MTNILLYITAYLIGGVPFGFLLAKFYAKVDVRKSGSGGIGATNVLRVIKEKDPTLAKKVSIITLLLDVFKGIFILLIAKFIFQVSTSTLWTLALLAVIGHCFSPFLKFEGGKGVATGMGVMMFLVPISTLVGLVTWAISAKVIKISSISSLLGLLALIVASYLIPNQTNIEIINSHSPILIIAFIIFYKHIPNIIRLFQGKEGRVV